MKKLLALVLAALLTLGCISALAEENAHVQFDPALTGILQDQFELKTAADWLNTDFNVALIAVLLPMDILNDDVTENDLLEYVADEAYVGENADGNVIVLYPSTKNNNVLLVAYSPISKLALFTITELSGSPTAELMQATLEQSCIRHAKTDHDTVNNVILSILSVLEK